MFNNKPHWVSMLPEVGGDTAKLPARYETLTNLIIAAETHLKKLKQLRADLGAEAERDAAKYWSPEEVRQAKLLYRNQQRESLRRAAGILKGVRK